VLAQVGLIDPRFTTRRRRESLRQSCRPCQGQIERPGSARPSSDAPPG
jgi:hypothetical protein